MPIGKRRAVVAGAALWFGLAAALPAASLPPPFDTPGHVQLALVRFFSRGDFFAAYLDGVEAQSSSLGATLHVFDSQQDPHRQARMLDQAIAAGVHGIIIQHGLPQTMRPAARRAVEAGIEVVAFDVDLDLDAVPQIEQSDRDLARLVLEQAIVDNGSRWQAAYVHVPGIAPLDRRHSVWAEFLDRHPHLQQVAVFGSLEPPIAQSTARLALPVLRAHPGITVVFAPYDEFARGVKQAAEAAGAASRIRIYSADISTADIAAMREPGSPWVATAATNPAAVGAVSVRALAMLIAGHHPGARVVVPPALITRQMLLRFDIHSMADLAARLPDFASPGVAHPDWIPAPDQ